MKKCPFCAEQIQIDAPKCRFCGEFFSETSGEPAPPASAPLPREGLLAPKVTRVTRKSVAVVFVLGLLGPALVRLGVSLVNRPGNDAAPAVLGGLFVVAGVVLVLSAGSWLLFNFLVRGPKLLVRGLIAATFLSIPVACWWLGPDAYEAQFCSICSHRHLLDDVKACKAFQEGDPEVKKLLDNYVKQNPDILKPRQHRSRHGIVVPPGHCPECGAATLEDHDCVELQRMNREEGWVDGIYGGRKR